MALNPALMAAIKGAKAKHTKGGFTQVKKLKEGKTRIRILPSTREDGVFWQDLSLHWIKMEPGGKPVAVAGCADHTYEKPCSICAAVDSATRSTRDDDELKFFKEMQARKEVLVNALIRSGPDASEDPVILSLTSTTFSSVLGIIEEYADEVGDILDVEGGIDFVMERTGKGLDTKYSVMPAAKSSAVPAGVMDKIHDLAEFVEKEHFSGGKDTKALNAIAELTGETASVGYASKAMLTGPGKVVDAEVEETEAAPPKAKAETAKGSSGKPSDEDLPEDMDDILKDLDDLS